MFEQVTPEEARRRLAEPDPPLLLDVRTPEEYADRHVEAALLIPLDQLVARVGEMACQFLAQRAGFARVANVRGGMSVWPD